MEKDTHPPGDGGKRSAGEQPTPGPIPLAIGGAGFVLVSDQPGEQRYSSPPGSACMVDVHWWRPHPAETGGPMMVASRREVTVAGERHEVVTTEMFEGVARQVDALFLSSDSWSARIVFTDCGPTEEDRFLETISLAPNP